MNFCPKCGARVTDEMLFCYKCGEKLNIDFDRPQPPSNVDRQPPPSASQYRNTNPMEVPPPPTYRMNLDSGYPPPNISSSNSDGYLSPNARGFGYESTNYTRTSRVTDESVLNPQLSNNGTFNELPPPPVIPTSNAPVKRNKRSLRNLVRKANPFKPKKHLVITILILGGILAGFYFFDDIAGADHDVIYEWDIKRDAVVQRLNYQNIAYPKSADPAGVIVAELYNSTIDFPIKRDLIEDKTLTISYFFNSIGNLRSISIVIPKINREEIYPLSIKIGESYAFDQNNTNPNEFAYITNSTKIWLIARNESGDYVDAVITLSGRQMR